MAMCFIPASKDCPGHNCGGSMRLVEESSTHYVDPFAWVCRNNGELYKKKKIAKFKYCKKLNIRYGTWLDSLNAQMVKILQVVYHKCEGLTLIKIRKQAAVCEWTVARITKIVRLLGANFMLQNPTLNKVGGLDSQGSPITVQIETCVGKRKFNKES